MVCLTKLLDLFSAALLTNDISLAIKMAPMMEAGMVHVNDTTVIGSRRPPFGGFKTAWSDARTGLFNR